MITVAEATRAVLDSAAARVCRSTEARRLQDGRLAVSAEDLVADHDFPPFDRVMMDGIAVAAAAVLGGRRSFAIEGTLAAGAPHAVLRDPNGAFEVMTGAQRPEGTDTVIRYEDLVIENGMAQLREGVQVTLGQNIHRRAADARRGDVIVPAGALMGAPHWAAAAGCGYGTVKVIKRPRVLVVATGDELCDVAAEPSGSHIRVSNSFAVAAALRDRGFEDITLTRVADNPSNIMALLRDELERHEICVFTGGVSAGRFDFLPSAFRELQIREVFHGVAQKPGKPLWFGEHDGGCLVFGLPGNPVSVLVTSCRYVVPCAMRMAGINPNVALRFAELRKPVDLGHAPGMTCFVPVQVFHGPDAVTLATPVLPGCSGDLVGPVRSDGFIECQPGRSSYAVGERCPLYLWSAL